MPTRHTFVTAAIGVSCLLAAAPSTVTRLHIDHVPNAIRTRAALTARDVDAQSTIAVESRDRLLIARLLRALEATPRVPESAHGDLRYAIRFEDARGRVVHLVYLDAFGRRGIVDGVPVRFERADLKEIVVEAYPALSR